MKLEDLVYYGARSRTFVVLNQKHTNPRNTITSSFLKINFIL